MVAMTPEQGTFLLSFFIPSIQNEHRITREVLQAIPAPNADHRPDANSRTALEIAWHIVAMEHRFYSAISAGAFDFSPNPKPQDVTTGAAVAKIYESHFQKDFAALSQLSGEQLTKIMDFRGMFQLHAVSYVQFNLHHTIHHRGQLSTYLRAMGGQVPAMYGESYDSAIKKSAQA